MKTTRAAVVVTWIALAACGGGGASPVFRTLFPDNREGDVREVLSRIEAQAATPDASAGPLVVAATKSHVLAHDPSAGRTIWKRAHRARSRPIITPRAVLFLENDEVVALDPARGRELWREAVEDNYLGAAGDEERVFVAFGTAVAATAAATERRAGALLALDAETGDTLWRLESDRQYGTPAVAGDLVLLPWDRQYLSILEAATGKEIARVRLRDDAILFVTNVGGSVYYGSRGLYRLTPRSSTGSQAESTYLAPPATTLPGDPRAWTDGFVAMQDEALADHIRLYVRPGGEGETIEVADDVFYFLFFRYVFGLSPEGGDVRWAARLEHESLAATTIDAGLFVVTESGDLVLLDAEKGLVRWRSSMGVSGLVSAAVDVAGFRPRADLQPADTPLREQLLEIANDRDNRLAPARAFAAEQIGKLAGAEATRDLLAIVARRDAPQVIRDAAGQALLGRRAGAADVLEALRVQHDFLEGRAAAPVAPLAAALASIREQRAVPVLLDHLEDPATDREDLPELIAALGEIGDRRAQGPLEDFVVRYHADDALGARPAATKAAADAVVMLGGRPARRTLAEIADDPFTLPDLRDHIRALLEPPQPRLAEAEATAGPVPGPASATSAPGTAAPAPELAPDYELPLRLGPDDIAQAMTKAAPQLRSCLRGDGPDRVRLVFVIISEGGIEHLAIQPENESVQACVQQKLERISFGRFREPRQQVTWQLERAPARAPTKAPPAKAPPTKRAPAKAGP